VLDSEGHTIRAEAIGNNKVLVGFLVSNPVYTDQLSLEHACWSACESTKRATVLAIMLPWEVGGLARTTSPVSPFLAWVPVDLTGSLHVATR